MTEEQIAQAARALSRLEGVDPDRCGYLEILASEIRRHARMQQAITEVLAVGDQQTTRGTHD
jgi:hypothetical protein